MHLKISPILRNSILTHLLSAAAFQCSTFLLSVERSALAHDRRQIHFSLKVLTVTEIQTSQYVIHLVSLTLWHFPVYYTISDQKVEGGTPRHPKISVCFSGQHHRFQKKVTTNPLVNICSCFPNALDGNNRRFKAPQRLGITMNDCSCVHWVQDLLIVALKNCLC